LVPPEAISTRFQRIMGKSGPAVEPASRNGSRTFDSAFAQTFNALTAAVGSAASTARWREERGARLAARRGADHGSLFEPKL
jgi:hypothetical protein